MGTLGRGLRFFVLRFQALADGGADKVADVSAEGPNLFPSQKPMDSLRESLHVSDPWYRLNP